MMIQDFLHQSAQMYPDKIALECGRQSWTYRRIDSATAALASTMLTLGVAPCERVIILLDNSCELVFSIFATLKIRAVFIVLSPPINLRKLRYIIKDSGASLIVTDEGKLAKVQEALSCAHKISNILLFQSTLDNASVAMVNSTCPPVSVYEGSKTDADAEFRLPKEAGTNIDLASIIYTSGSTGTPKGVMATHLNVVSAVNSINTFLHNSARDIVLNVLPLSFDYGLYQIFLMFACGGTLVLEKRFGYPHALLEKLDTSQVTGFPLVPTIASLFLRIDPSERPTFPALRYLTTTGDVLSLNHINHLGKLFPHVQLFSMYGLTECKRVSYLPPAEIRTRPTSVGRPIPNCDVTIVADNGQPVACGQIGELVVRGPHVMQGYWNSPEETQRVFRKGAYRMDVRLYTGDLFRMDPDGYLYFVSRKDNLLKIGDERVSPLEIESILNEIDEIAESAVIASEDRYGVKFICALIIILDDQFPSKSKVLKYCSERLEPQLVPKQIHFLKSLPKNENGKIDRQRLHRILPDT
jgi:amino acid adenylation domain-containing protein